MKLAKLSFAASCIVLGASGIAQADDVKKMTVYKTPWCGCCKVWTQAMKKAGSTIEIQDMEDLALIKRQAGVPRQLEACHTAVLGQYIIEGHVPLEAVNKLHQEQPAIRGIAVAGMPQGSLGMGYDPKA